MATALTIYGTTSNLEDSSTNGYIGELETSTSTATGYSAYSGVGERTTTPAGWFSIPLTSLAAGAGKRGTTLSSQPAFGTGNATGKPNGTAYNGLSGKQTIAGSWSISGTVVGQVGHSTSGTLHLRIGTRKGSTFTQYGSDITVAVDLTPNAAFTATGTIPEITFPTSTTWLYIDATIFGAKGFLVGTDGASIELGSTLFKIITPGYRLPVVTGTAAFTGSGTFAATPTYVGTASFVASGVFGYFGPRATFLASGVFSGQGAAFLPSKTGMPATSVQLALTGTCWEGSNWTTIGPLTSGVTTGYGRQHQLQRVEPAQVGLTLSNRDGSLNPWSKNSRFYNQLPPTDSNPTTGEGTWSATGATLARVTTPVRYGAASWSLTATASGTVTAQTDSRTTAVPGRTYSAIVYAEAATTARAVKVSIVWRDATGTVVSTTTGGSRDDATSGWGTGWTARGVCPAGAVAKDVRITFASVSDAEVHYVACAGIFDVTFSVPIAASQAWCVGQQAPLWPGQPFRIVANWQTTTYVVAAGVIESWVPKYKTVAGDIVVAASDLLSILATTPVPEASYVAVVQGAGPALFWKLGTAAGTTNVLDSSGNGHTGTASAAHFSWDGSALVPKTSALSAQFKLTKASTTGTITGSLAQPEAWSVELVLDFSATNDQPTLESTAMEVNVFSWGSGATRINLRVVQKKSGVNTLYVSKGTSEGSTSSPSALISGTSHVVVARRATGTVQLFVNNVPSANQTLALSTSDPTFQLGGLASIYLTGSLYVQDVSIYDSRLTATEIQDHYDAYKTGLTKQKSGAMIKTLLLSCGIPSSALGTIDTGTIEVKPPDITTGETQLLSVLQTIDNTEQGLFFAAPTGKLRFYSRAYISSSPTSTTAQAVVSNDTTPDHLAPAVPIVPARDKTTLFNYCAVGLEGATATAATVTVKVASTAKSIAKYGARMMTGFTGMYFAEAETAEILAELMVSRFASPQTRVRAVQLSSVTERGSYLPQMLGLKLLDAIEVRWQPTDGSDSPFVQTAQIEQITHTVTKTRWDTTFVLAMPL